jgi:hypothetical protein
MWPAVIQIATVTSFVAMQVMFRCDGAKENVLLFLLDLLC